MLEVGSTQKGFMKFLWLNFREKKITRKLDYQLNGKQNERTAHWFAIL